MSYIDYSPDWNAEQRHPHKRNAHTGVGVVMHTNAWVEKALHKNPGLPRLPIQATMLHNKWNVILVSIIASATPGDTFRAQDTQVSEIYGI
jgi:hypothetical protein